nr:hypothetical protein CPGR_03568 [Mycolicibacterium komanii]
MDLALIGRGRAAGSGAAAVFGEQHQPLRFRGQPAPAAQEQGLFGGLVEDRQIRMRRRRLFDDVAHRQQRPPTGHRMPGAGLQLLQRGGDQQGGRHPVVAPQRPGREQGPAHRAQGVVVALPARAGIGAHRLRRRLLIGAGLVRAGLVRAGLATLGLIIGGVVASGGGPHRQHRLQGGAGGGVDDPAQLTHPVEALTAQPQPALRRAHLIREIPIRVQIGRQPLRGRPQLLGSVLGRQLRQLGFGGLAHIKRCRRGDLLGEKPPNHPHMLRTHQPLLLRGRGARQHRLENLTGHRAPRRQLRRFGHPAGRLGFGDPQQHRQRAGHAVLTQLL